MIGWITTIVAVLLLPVAWFLGCQNVHRRDELALWQARIAKDMAETERDTAQASAQKWQETAILRQKLREGEQRAAKETAHNLQSALTSNSELRTQRDALTLQLSEITAKNSTHAAIAPTRPKQGRPPSSSPR